MYGAALRGDAVEDEVDLRTCHILPPSEIDLGL